MPRQKAVTNCSILPWLSAKPDSKDKRFMQIGNSLLLSEKFHKLSSGAQHLYFCMAMESGGKRDFLFPQASAKKYGIAPSSFDRYKKELLNAGCVQLKSSGRITREANEYCFSIDAFKDA